MTIEEMIEHLKHIRMKKKSPRIDVLRSIAAALRAGQAMRDEAYLLFTDVDGLNVYGVSDIGFGCAVRDWDAVVGEKE